MVSSPEEIYDIITNKRQWKGAQRDSIARNAVSFRVGFWWIGPKPMPCICLVASKMDCEILVGLLEYHNPMLSEQRGAAKSRSLFQN